MIQGFDIETQPLTDYEKETVLPEIYAILAGRFGVERAIKNGRIVSLLPGIKVSQERVRKIINSIRLSGIVPCLVASSKGYYIANTEEELMEYEKSLEGREEAIRAVRKAIERQRIEWFEYRDTLF